MKSQSIQSVFRSSKWQVKPKLHRYPPKRWGHTGVISKNKLYIYGGKTGKLKEPLYEIDCDTFQKPLMQPYQGEAIYLGWMPPIKGTNFLRPFQKDGKFYIILVRSQVLNDCISVSFKDRHCFWSLIAQFPLLKQRESHATTVLKDKYIVLYGGCNQDDIYEDFWVFNTDLEVWFQIKTINGKLRKRQNCTMTTIKDKIYMFGGQIEDGNYSNQLYCLSFTDIDFSSKDRIPIMNCQKITPMTQLLPQGRSSHAAISYMDRYLIIIAGESILIDGKGKENSILLNDVWCFDTQKCIWQPIQVPTKNLFKPRSCFSASLYRNKIYIFGGLLSLQNYKSSDELLILSFSQTIQKSLQICNLCKLHYRAIELIHQQKSLISTPNRSSFDFNLRNLYKVSRMIKNPFDAFCLIVQGFYKMKYQSLAIDVIQGKIIMVQGLGREICQEDFQEIVNKYQFVDEINTDDHMILQALQSRVHEQNLQIFNFNIKNACSRLGINFLLMNRRGGVLIDAMLVSPQSIHYCQFNTQDDSVGSQQQRSAQIIRNYMYKNNLNTTLINPSSFTIIITDLQRISPTQSQLRVNGKGNIQISIPNSIPSLNPFPNPLPYTNTNTSTLTNLNNKKPNLQSHISTYFLNKPSLKLLINNKQINYHTLKEQYDQNQYMYEPVIQHDFKAIFLRGVQKQRQRDRDREREKQRDQGCVYIYRDGLRVGKFYNGTRLKNVGKINNNNGGSNKKDKDNSNHHNYNGVQGYVQISLNYELNLLRFRVENHKIIQQQLENICKQFREISKKRGNDYPSYQLEDNIKKL